MRRAASVIVGSLVLHALLLVALPRRFEPKPPAPAGGIELEVVTSRSATPAPAHPEPDRWPGPPAATERPREAPAPRVQRKPGESAPEMIVAPTPHLEPATVPVPEPARPAATLDLSPRAAALSVPRAPADGALPVAPFAPSDRSASLSADLRAAASVQADALRARRKLELRRDPDGTCHYEGTAFDATIHPDGGVEFAERDIRAEPRGPEEPPEKPFTVEDTQAEQRIEASIKFTPHAVDAERAWFMRETQRLRDELSDAALARELERREVGLRRELDRIWCDESRTKPQRRRAIFELWAGTSVDEVGARGRRAIIDYVRRNLPAGGADAYTREELTRLNLDRVQHQRFEPYASAAP